MFYIDLTRGPIAGTVSEIIAAEMQNSTQVSIQLAFIRRIWIPRLSQLPHTSSQDVPIFTVVAITIYNVSLQTDRQTDMDVIPRST